MRRRRIVQKDRIYSWSNVKLAKTKVLKLNGKARGNDSISRRIVAFKLEDKRTTTATEDEEEVNEEVEEGGGRGVKSNQFNVEEFITF